MNELSLFSVILTESYIKKFRKLKLSKKDFNEVKEELQKIPKGKKFHTLTTVKPKLFYIKITLNRVQYRVMFHIDSGNKIVRVTAIEKRDKAYNKEKFKQYREKAKEYRN